MNDTDMIAQVRRQMREAHDLTWQRYPLVTDFPTFHGARRAAQNALAAITDTIWLVMRDACLGPMREAIRAAGRSLIVPTRDGREFVEIPAKGPTPGCGGRSGALRLQSLPPGSAAYRGPIDVVVVGCHAFDPDRRHLMTLDTCRTQHLLEDWRDGLPDGWRLGTAFVIALASDAQQVSEWPEWAEGHEADLIVTPTRLIALRTGEQLMLTEPKDSPVYLRTAL